MLKITLVRSPIGYARDQRATAEALGLRKLHHSAMHDDTPAIRGMLHKIRHLIEVEEVPADASR
ncbi:MAG: 50S ribosomal protein L30 [Thermaerobacter sp.]|nr:50S ribosomal protein L30 [Thermaerobacter sp.]